MGNGISKNDIDNLKDAGYYTVQALSMATRKDLEKIKGISEAKANKLLDVSGRKNPEKTGFRNGESIFAFIAKTTPNFGEIKRLFENDFLRLSLKQHLIITL